VNKTSNENIFGWGRVVRGGAAGAASSDEKVLTFCLNAVYFKYLAP